MESSKIYNKIIGYLLLVVGVFLILFALYQSYGIFTGKLSAPLLFKMSAPIQQPKAGSGGILQDLQKQLNEEMSKQIGQMLPADALPKILNLMSWSILAGILIFGGGQIAGLGIKLVK